MDMAMRREREFKYRTNAWTP